MCLTKVGAIAADKKPCFLSQKVQSTFSLAYARAAIAPTLVYSVAERLQLNFGYVFAEIIVGTAYRYKVLTQAVFFKVYILFFVFTENEGNIFPE